MNPKSQPSSFHLQQVQQDEFGVDILILKIVTMPEERSFPFMYPLPKDNLLVLQKRRGRFSCTVYNRFKALIRTSTEEGLPLMEISYGYPCAAYENTEYRHQVPKQLNAMNSVAKFHGKSCHFVRMQIVEMNYL